MMHTSTVYHCSRISRLSNGGLRINCGGIDGSALWSGFLEIQPDDENYPFWSWMAKRWYPPSVLCDDKLEKAIEQHRLLLMSGQINEAGERLRPTWLRSCILAVERYKQAHWFKQCLLKAVLGLPVLMAGVLWQGWPGTGAALFVAIILGFLAILILLCGEHGVRKVLG